MLDPFAEELRLARAASGMSQTALAEALSYSGALVAKVETCERRPSLDFARRCDAVFGARPRGMLVRCFPVAGCSRPTRSSSRWPPGSTGRACSPVTGRRC